MKKFLLAFCFCLSCMFMNAQSSLNIGDTIPNIRLDHLISYPSRSAYLKDFNKHCLILDFWGTFCGTCVSAFPFMEKVEKEYSGKLQVLLVSNESDKDISRFFKLREQSGYPGCSAPAACNDSVLSRLFVHDGVPHYVWINEKGMVYAITGLLDLNEKNLEAFIKGEPSAMEQKTDVYLDYDYKKPLFVNGNGGQGESLLCQSVLSGYTDKMLTIGGVNSGDMGYTATEINQNIPSLYQLAYDKGEYDGGRGEFGIPDCLTVLDVADTTPYCYLVNGRINKENLYCYNLNLSKKRPFNELKSMMKADLDRYFHMRVKMEKRKIPCWVLTADDSSVIRSKSTISKSNYQYYSLDMQNTRLSELVIYLQYYFMASLRFPIIDETGIKGGVDLKLVAYLSSPESLNKALAPFKMHLTKEERWVEMLILQDPDKDDHSALIDLVRDNKMTLNGN